MLERVLDLLRLAAGLWPSRLRALVAAVLLKWFIAATYPATLTYNAPKVIFTGVRWRREIASSHSSLRKFTTGR